MGCVGVPKIIVKNDVVEWVDNSITSCNLTYTSGDKDLWHYFAGGSTLSKKATSEGSGWKTSLTSAESGTLVAGNVSVSRVLYDTGVTVNPITIDTVMIEVRESLIGIAAPYDGRTDAQKQLDAIDAAITDIITTGISGYKIKGREADYQDLKQLRDMRTELKATVAREKAGGVKNTKIVWGNL